MGMSLSVGGIKKAALSGFNKNRLTNTAFSLAGIVATAFVAKKVQDVAGKFLPSDGVIGKVAKVGTTLLTAGAVGYAAKRFVPSRANAVLTGGLIMGVADGINEFFPSISVPIGMKGLADIADENALAWNLGDFADPYNVGNAFPARQPIGDFATPPQVRGAFPARQPIGNYADHVVGEEISMSM